MSIKRLFAVDPGLTSSGWALFNLKDEKLLAVGRVASLPPSNPLAIRLEDLQRKIASVFDQVKLCSSDVLVCEAPTTMRDPRAAFLVEQVRGIFETIARQRLTKVPGRINPRTVHYEVMGLRGKQLKREIVKATAVSIVDNLYSTSLRDIGFPLENGSLKKHQDVVDAILVGACGLARITQSQNAGEPLEVFFSQNKKAGSATGWQIK